MMGVREPNNPIDLIEQAKEMGFIDSNVTKKCVHCKVIFPNEYNNCPQCQTENFSVTVLWE